MKALFCYDGPLYKAENGDYFDSILNDQMFQRYFAVADELEVIIRTRPISREQAIKKMSQLTNPMISVIECPNLSSFSGMMINTAKVKKILKERILNADLVFIRLPSVIGNYSIGLCKSLKKKYLVEVVGCPWDSYWNYSIKGKLVAPFSAVMMRRQIKNAPYVLYVTNKFLQKRYPTKGKSIGCSNVELQPVTTDVLISRLKKISEYKKNTRLIIGTAAGLDVLYKGQQYIIQALGQLKKQGIDCFEYQLIGGGKGTYLKKVAEMNNVADQIKIIGQMPHDEVFTWLDSIDIYAQPSRQEGLPRAMIEAMSRGIPCIGAKTAGIPELIDNKYIFTNSKTEVEEISKLLLDMRSEGCIMERLAFENFHEALKYQRSTLVERRTRFFMSFAE